MYNPASLLLVVLHEYFADRVVSSGDGDGVEIERVATEAVGPVGAVVSSLVKERRVCKTKS